MNISIGNDHTAHEVYHNALVTPDSLTLHRGAQFVTPNTTLIRMTIIALKATMDEVKAGGIPAIAIAAPQIGDPYNIIYYDLSNFPLSPTDSIGFGSKNVASSAPLTDSVEFYTEVDQESAALKSEVSLPNHGFMYNLEIYEYSEDTTEVNEGCLSLPNLFVTTERSIAIKFRCMYLGLAVADGTTFIDNTAVSFSGTAVGFPAVMLQHEYDHLRGALITDRMVDSQAYIGYDSTQMQALRNMIRNARQKLPERANMSKHKLQFTLPCN